MLVKPTLRYPKSPAVWVTPLSVVAYDAPLAKAGTPTVVAPAEIATPASAIAIRDRLLRASRGR